MARDYEAFFADEHNKSVVLDLVDELDIDESYEKAGEALSGETFVITGSLEHYKSRTELKKEIETQGGKVAGSVSKNTSYLDDKQSRIRFVKKQGGGGTRCKNQ